MNADQVRDKIASLVDAEAADALGTRYKLSELTWADDPQNDEGLFPWIVEDADGNRFEVEIEVFVRAAKP